MISSGSNAKIKTVNRLMRERRFRHRQRQFVVEGVRWLRDARDQLSPTEQTRFDNWIAGTGIEALFAHPAL